MDFERSGLSETFTAVTAAVRLFPGVRPLVSPHPGQMWESPAAKPTGVRPLSSVNTPVNLQRARLAEALPAVRAGVRPRARVNVQVDAEVTVRVECPAALGAEEPRRFVRVLRALVLQQLGRPGEGSGAIHAGVRRQQGRLAGLLLLLLLRLPLLLVRTRLVASGGRSLTVVAGARALRRVEGTEVRGGQARGRRAVMVVEAVVGEVGRVGLQAPLAA